MGSGRADLGIYGRYSSKASQSGVPNSCGSAPTYYHEDTLPQVGHDHAPTNHGSGRERQIYRFAMQSAARELLPREMVAMCMRSVVPVQGGASGVNVLYAPVGQAAHYGGLQMCKSVWHCPVCGAKISERRREELSDATKRWEGRMLLVTFTLQHHAREDLSVVLKALTDARKQLVSGRWANNFSSEYGIVGMVRALELTHGENGWHPHLHVLYFTEGEIPIIPFEMDIKSRWTHCVQTTGRYASLSHGCDVRFSDAAISEYIAKFGKEPKWTTAHELTKAAVKLGRAGGRTPMQLLADYLAGDQDAGRLWLQYAVNLKGERQIYWTPKLRARLKLKQEKTDEEIAVEQEEIAILLASLSPGAWRVVLANDARGELLQVSSSGDQHKVQAFLCELGIAG